MVIERYPMGETPAEVGKQLLQLWRMPEEDLMALLATSMMPSLDEEFDESWDDEWEDWMDDMPFAD